MSTIRGRKAHSMTCCKASHCLVACIAVLLGVESRAQPGPFGLEDPLENLDALTPQALIAAIEAHNPDLQSVAAEAEAAALRIESAGALADPTFAYALAPNSIGSDIGVRHIGRFSQPLPWPGTRDLKRTVATHRADAVAQDFAATRLQLIAMAHNSYAEWHYLHRAIEINAATQALLTELTRVVETRYATGSALQQDVLQVEVETVLLQERQLALEHDRIALRARINALLNRDPADSLPPPAAIAPPVSTSTCRTSRRIQPVHPSTFFSASI